MEFCTGLCYAELRCAYYVMPEIAYARVLIESDYLFEWFSNPDSFLMV